MKFITGKPQIFLILSLLLLTYLSIYGVRLDENIAVYRFGKIVSIHKNSGLKLKWPFESIIRTLPEKVRRIELGFRSNFDKKDFTDRKAAPQLWEVKHESIKKIPDESLIITGDENIVDVNCVIHYHIKNIKHYLINIKDSEKFIRNISEASLKTLVGKERLETILVKTKSGLQNRLKKDIQARIDARLIGIKIIKINLQDIHPPVEVVHSFREVASAREDKNTSIYEAMEFKESEIPNARATAHKMTLNAKATAAESLLISSGKTKRYKQLKGLYKKWGKSLKLKKYYDYIAQTYSSAELFIISDDLFKNFEFFLGTSKKEIERKQ